MDRQTKFNMKMQSKYKNKVVYTAASDACGWAGTVTKICSTFSSNAQKREVNTDGPTDGQTDGPTDIVTYRVACTRLKTRS